MGNLGQQAAGWRTFQIHHANAAQQSQIEFC
jgi:hypothetical protein